MKLEVMRLKIKNKFKNFQRVNLSDKPYWISPHEELQS